MDSEQRVMMNESELASFARKLDRWAQSLPDKERTFLAQMLADAADAANEEVSGYANLSSLAQDDVAGYVMGLNSFVNTIAGYAEGVTRAEAELSSPPFATGERDR